MGSRIAIIGNAGRGKSIVAKRLSLASAARHPLSQTL